jgi:hypothetical protein
MAKLWRFDSMKPSTSIEIALSIFARVGGFVISASEKKKGVTFVPQDARGFL